MEKQRQINKKDIAVIGISCEFPQSKNISEFWENLIEGNELLHFYSDKELKEFGISDATIKNKEFIKVKAEIEELGGFDYAFFGYTKEEASCMDPQTRMLHQLTWTALEDAACNIDTYKGKIGMYTSISDNLNWQVHSMLHPNSKVNSFYQSQLSNKNFAHTLVSYNLDFKGPSLLIDTACSSSLASLHVACRSLLLKECNMAMAAGISLDSTKNKGYFYQEGMISSKDGHCRPFDQNSSGTVGGNGGAVVVLKRLEEAINDRDNIYAIIKSSAVNNDGRERIGYTAPSVKGQSTCIKLAHRIANIPLESISYIETHGTATKLGDPIEIEALNKAFNYNTEHKCAIGSVKSNMGHLDAAAGIAGLLKTTLALKNKKIPKSLHFNTPNQEINFNEGPFYVNDQLKNWESDNEYPLRAGVSSFGIGGTNVHVVMEEPPVLSKINKEKKFYIVPFSAKTKKSLLSYQRKISEFLKEGKGELKDLAYTLSIGRKPFTYRNTIVAKDSASVLKMLEQTEIIENSITKAKQRPIIFLFSGQGSQYFGMAERLYKENSYFKSIINSGLSYLEALTGESYKEILGYESKESFDKNLINETKYTQPLLFLVEYALAKQMILFGIEPTAMIGHSLGEYVAACISEVFTLEDALRIIVKRAELMNALPKGVMLAVGESSDKIEESLPKELSIAVINTITSCVVSGEEKIIEDYATYLESINVPHKKLKTSHAFHSKMMNPILDVFGEFLKEVKFSSPKYKIVSNLTGKIISSNDMISPEYWCRHLRETVCFYDGITTILSNYKESVFIELGPGNTLETFSKQHPNFNLGSECTISMISHPKNIEREVSLFESSLAKLWALGCSVNWEEYYSDDKRNKISAPTYCFDEKNFESSVNPLEEIKGKVELFPGMKRNISEWFYFPNWKRSTFLNSELTQDKSKKYLVFINDEPLIEDVVKILENERNQVVKVTKGEDFLKYDDYNYCINFQNKENYLALYEELKRNFNRIDHIIYSWKTKDEITVTDYFLHLIEVGKLTINLAGEIGNKVTFLLEYGNNIYGDEILDAKAVISNSLLQVLEQENPKIKVSSIDIFNNKFNVSATSIIDEIKGDKSSINIAYRKDQRWELFYDNVKLPKHSNEETLKENGLYIITGGLGKLGGILTRYLSEKYKGTIILLGRTNIEGYDVGKNPKIDSKISLLKNLQEEFENIYYCQVDVSDNDSLHKVFENITNEHGDITGVIHAAGVVEHDSFKTFENISQSDVEQQFTPKVLGVNNIYSLNKQFPIGFVWIASSLSSILGGLTFTSYASANRYLDGFIQQKRNKLTNWFSVNLDGLVEERISDAEMIEVFEKSFIIGKEPQLITSVREIKTINEIEKEEEFHNENLEDDFITERPDISTVYEEPENEIQRKICSIWETFFGYKKIGVLDDFFDLGGDSLKAMTLLKKIQKAFSVEIKLQEFYTKSTVKDIAEQVEILKKVELMQNQSKKKNTIKI
ncbi:SDR family NAD(P)-dependent oxidoreductase [Tenacibaculum larymnensis]|uniref:SDR family NAD(P)-dependent oxidoreductase n=1 Tax=Tenacibaculum larymnensis TaxID=2878201 RepID=A0A9X4EN23_9FLAO|nr:SDR family NAD(P)-dependent oxidoreductase [Tenacibaculum larymnensis]MDE1207124.1 SDR family NAD(P)-dependent oxidoreductase [Tenacibaculum larymnensis]